MHPPTESTLKAWLSRATLSCMLITSLMAISVDSIPAPAPAHPNFPFLDEIEQKLKVTLDLPVDDINAAPAIKLSKQASGGKFAAGAGEPLQALDDAKVATKPCVKASPSASPSSIYDDRPSYPNIPKPTVTDGYPSSSPLSSSSLKSSSGSHSSTSTHYSAPSFSQTVHISTTSTRRNGDGGYHISPSPRHTTTSRRNDDGGYHPSPSPRHTSTTSRRNTDGGYHPSPSPHHTTTTTTTTKNDGGYEASSTSSKAFVTTSTVVYGTTSSTISIPTATTSAPMVKRTDIAQCPALNPRNKPATSVWDLRVDDIDVIMGVGDSIMAGFAAKVGSIKDFLSFKMNPLWEYRGVNFATGGEADSKSVANLLKRYSPELTGVSKGTMNFHICWGPICTARTFLQPDNVEVQGLNSAQSGAWTVNWGGMVDYLNDYLTTVDPLSSQCPSAQYLRQEHYGSEDDDQLRRGNITASWKRRMGKSGPMKNDDAALDFTTLSRREPGGGASKPKPAPKPPIPHNSTAPRRYKLAIVELGFNDLCTGCKDWAQKLVFGVDHYENNLRKMLRAMQSSLRDTVAVVFTPFKLSQLKPLQEANSYCKRVTSILSLCGCAQNQEGRDAMDVLAAGYARVAEKVVNEINAERDPGFGVLFDPGMGGLDLVTAANKGGGIRSLLSGLDCFHPTKSSHDAIARGLWNNLFVPRTSRVPYDILETQYLCPTDDSRLIVE